MSSINENSRMNPELKINEEKTQILDSKEFLIKCESEQYHLKIEINQKYIFFNISPTDKIIDSSYQNKYDLNSIVRLLNLIPNKYNDLSSVLKFIEKAYSVNKIGIVHDDFNLILTIQMPMGFEEEIYKLTLYKVILSNNDIINQIVTELNNIKKIIKTKGYENDDINNTKNKNIQLNNDSLYKKLEDLTSKMNYKDSLINELNQKMIIKDKEIRDIYSKLIDKDTAIKEMNKTIKKNKNKIYEKESINQLKIKDEEIDKKLNEKAYELNNKLIDKDNALNDINKKLIEKDYLINEINKKLNAQENQINKIDDQIKELKKSMNKLLKENYSLSEIKIPYDSNGLKYNYSSYNLNSKNEDLVNNITKYKSKEYITSANNNNTLIKINKKNCSKKRSTVHSMKDCNPNDLIYKYDIVNTNTKGGLNDIFEVFKSIKDNEDYLISPNKINFHLDIITLKDNKFFGSLKGHQKKVTCVRYFLNNYNKSEYLISSDEIGIVLIWDINNSYTKLFTINTKYNDIIYSCLLMFIEDKDNNENKSNNSNKNTGYIITSTFDISKENQNSATKIYSMENGEFINYVKNTNTNSIFYLLSWLNKKNKKNYIIQFCYMKILITNLLDDDDIYAELSQEQKLSHYSGFIYEKKEGDEVYLYSSSKNGIINIWDLYKKVLINNININGSILCHIIQWDDKYAIVADYNRKSFKIINLQTLKVENDIGECHTKEVKSIKKIKHPLLGDSLLSAGNDNIIKLWSL